MPDHVDLVLYDRGPCRSAGTYTFHPGDPDATVREILHGNDDIAVPLARQFPAFRKQVVERLIHTISRENALFAVATALPDVVPNLLELPWVFGEWASDTAFLTANQIRMAFLIAAACDREIGFSRQKLEILSIGGGAFGWRAIARELVGQDSAWRRADSQGRDRICRHLRGGQGIGTPLSRQRRSFADCPENRLPAGA